MRRGREESHRGREARDPADGRVACPVGCLGCLVTSALMLLLGVAALILLSELGG